MFGHSQSKLKVIITSGSFSCNTMAFFNLTFEKDFLRVSQSLLSESHSFRQEKQTKLPLDWQEEEEDRVLEALPRALG